MSNNKWGSRFMAMAELVASWSKDPSTKVGAVIVDNAHRIISVGFNGFPKGVQDNPFYLTDRKHKYPRTLHAEINSILFAKQDLKDCIIYCTHHPCSNCTAIIIQSGIKSIVAYKPSDDFLSRWGEDVEISQSMCKDAAVEIVLY